MLLGIAPICLTCQRLRGVEAGIGFTCDAFGGGIPLNILASRQDHRDPVKGDGGLRYRPKASQYQAHYCAVSTDGEQCRICTKFLLPNGCREVEGQISPLGWCPGYDHQDKVKNESPRRRLFVDLDGVLADFDAGYKALGGPEEVDWTLIGVEFWRHLPLMPGALTLWNAVKDQRPTILTGLPRELPFDAVAAEKRAWVADYLGPDIEVVCCLSKGKCQYAKPGDVLIDDREKYRALWEAAGGIWITHHNAETSIAALDALGSIRADAAITTTMPGTLLDDINKADAVGKLAAAGVMHVTPEGKVLLVRRTAEGDHEGEWAFPGGKLEDGEGREEAARRECEEETGRRPDGPMHEWTRRVRNGVDFTTYLHIVPEEFEPKLNEEHDDWGWFDVPGMKAAAQRAQRADKAFTESEHPRGQPDNPGQFAEKGGGATHAREALIAAPAGRTEWPAHIQKLKLPPAWRDVRISEDPKSSLQAIGYDAKGRPQYVYSAKHRDSQTAKKFARIKTLDRKFDQVSAQNQRALKARDLTVREHAAITALILDMGLRPGSEKETGAEEKAFGATTLRAEHVLTDGKNTWLRFTGKKGVKLSLPVDNEVLAADLAARAKKGGQLFPEVNDNSLRRYVGKLDGGGFKTKDLRTLKGTRTAAELVNQMKAPTTEKDYKKAVKEVATGVAKVLGNTPTVALQSYISPYIFSQWREGISGGKRAAAA